MNRSTLRRAVAVTLTVATALMGGLTSSATAAVDAVDAQTSVKIAKASALYGTGAVVLVDVAVKCQSGGEYSSLYVRVSQVGDPYGTVYGENGVQLICTGAKQIVQIAVVGFAPFQVGAAFVTAEAQVCEFECMYAEDARTVDVVTGVEETPRYRGPDLKYTLPKTGQIQAAGAGAIVLVPYTCRPGARGSFEALLAQGSPDGWTNASGDSSELTCTDTNRTGVLAFHASSTGWAAGTAFLLVNGVICASEVDPCTVGTTYRSLLLA